MDIRVYLFIIIIVSGFLFMMTGDTPRNRRIYIDIVLLLLLLESCLRGLSVGSDTFRYSELFAEVQSMSWREIIQAMKNRYLYHVDDTDAGYIVLEKLVHLFSHDFNVFLFVCGIFFFIPFRQLLRWIDLDMKSLVLLFVFYVALFNPIAMSGTRKVVSLGLTIWVFLDYMDKKYIWAGIWLLIAASIHMTAIVVLLVPVIDFLSAPIKKGVHGVSFLFIPFMIIASSSVILFMAEAVDNEHYAIYAQDPEGGGMTFVILMELLFLACFFLFKISDLQGSKKLSHLYSMLPMATILVPLITNNGSMIRLSQYFHVYTLLFLPMLVDRVVNKKNQIAVIVVLIVVLMAMSLRTNGLGSEYYFFWNDMGVFIL